MNPRQPRRASWPLFLSLALGLAAASPFLSGLFDSAQPLERFPDRAIGRTVLEGVDGSGYARRYVALWTVLLATFGLSYLGLRRLEAGLQRVVPRGALRREGLGLSRLSEVLVVILVLRVVLDDDRFLALAALVAGGLGLLALFAAMKLAVLRRAATSPGVHELLASADALVAAFALAAALVFTGRFLSGAPLSFGAADLAAVGGVWALILGLVVLHLGTATRGVAPAELRSRVGEIHGRLAIATLPLVLFPMSVPLVNELQYVLHLLTPRHLAMATLAALIGASAALYGLARHHGWRISTARVVHRGIYPAVVATVGVFATHRHTWHLGRLDYFHLGELTLPAQQLFAFGKLPQLDLRLTHSFSDLFYPGLYALLTGRLDLDLLIWTSWVPEVVAMVLLYVLLARTISPAFAVLAAGLLPVTNLASAYYAPALVPGLLLVDVVRRPSRCRFAALWLAALGLLLWRIDFGLAGGVALGLALTPFLLRRRSGQRWRHASTALAAVTGAAFLALVAVAWLAGRPALETLGTLFGSYAHRLVTRTRSVIVEGFDAVAVLQYYLLPAVAAVHLAALTARRWVGRLRLAPEHFLLLYLAAFSLIQSLRSLERHSLIERFNPYFFVLLLALAPLLYRRAGGPRETPVARAVFLATLAAAALFVLPPARFGVSRYHLLERVGGGPLFEPREWRGDERRVAYDAAPHRLLIDFLEARLSPDQTFFDFSNSPLLFTLAGREFPTWIIPNLVQTSEGVQRRVVGELEALRAAGRLPIVVFEQGNQYWDNADGVANEVRSYRVAEYIYRHYRPLARLDGYEVWQEADVPGSLAPFVERWTLPAAEGFEAHDVEGLPAPAGWAVRAGHQDPYFHGFLDPGSLPSLEGVGGWYLSFSARSSQAGGLQVFFKTDGGRFHERASVTTQIPATAEAGPHLLPVVVGARARGARLLDLRFDPPAGATFELRDVELWASRAGVVPLLAHQVHQRFELARLPSIWAEHDPLDARATTPILATLIDTPLEVEDELVLDLPPGLDLSLGAYLHLRLRPRLDLDLDAGGRRPPVEVAVLYGDDLENGFTFNVAASEDPHHDRLELPPRRPPGGLHDMTSFALDGDRLIFQPTGPDPYVLDAFELGSAPPVTPGEEVYLRFEYRARGGGPLQLFWGLDAEELNEAASDFVPLCHTDESPEPAVAVLRLPVRARPYRLRDLRFDPPDGTWFELVRAELVRPRQEDHDHLLRLSTQWAWTHRPPSRMVIRTSAPIRLTAAYLRRGD